MADNEMKWEKTDENRYEIAGKEFQIEIWLDTDGTFSWRISKGIVSTIASGDYVENVDDLEAITWKMLMILRQTSMRHLRILRTSLLP